MTQANEACSLLMQPSADTPSAHPASDRVSSFLVRALAEVAQQRSVSAAALLGASADALHHAAPDHAFFPRPWFQSLFDRAVELTGDPALGLSCGLHASATSFGLMSPLVGHSPGLRRALELVIQFQPLLIDGLRVELTERLGVAKLRCDLSSHGTAHRSLVEMMVAGLARTLQTFGVAQSEIHCVSFEYARPAYYHAYARALGGAERFAQDFTGIEFSASALDRGNLHHHSELHTLMLAQAEQNLQRVWRPMSFTERVRALMRNRSLSALPDMEATARELGLSVRSLRRYLDEEGTSFRLLSQAALHESACSMLRNPAISLQSIAHSLGFSDASAFHRAFRRWSDLTPGEYRSAFLGSDQEAPEPAAQP
jgi:AraC-like DNA-binding protein